MTACDFGFIGLGVMGQNLALNVESKSYRVAIYDQLPAVIKDFSAQYADRNLVPNDTLKDFVDCLAKPRLIQIMVPAGAAVDAVIDSLVPLLDQGDLIIDGGNTFFEDTVRREHYLGNKGIRFLGAGVSGGEEGALKGPSIMPSGDASSWAMVRPLFEAIAAKVDGEPCVVHVGAGGAGHYVKMVHNGIEYADMQLICEAYNILHAAGFDNSELSVIFDDWNKGPLESYLIAITAQIFKQKDPETEQDLIDLIVDCAGQKGTGRWTAMTGVDAAVPLPTIASSVEARILSSRLGERQQASRLLEGPNNWQLVIDSEDKKALVNSVFHALYCSKIVAYAQGLDLIYRAGKEHQWGLNISKIAKIWRGGCIIRAKFLTHIADAFAVNAELSNLMLAPFFTSIMNQGQQQWREVVAIATKGGIPVPSIGNSLYYYDSYRASRLPANLSQAQRDFFGAHTYQRSDKPTEAFFHNEYWPDIQ